MRGPLTEADRKAQRLETEVRTLTNLLGSASGGLWPPVVDAISVARGYEAALGAALGDDLDASTNTSAPAHWAAPEGEHRDAPLPEGVASLASLVQAPPALQRRLAQIGVVLRGEGKALRPLLKVGQRLVSKEGDLWRWDGFVAAAEAPTPAARRLVEKNRLGDLSRQAEAARQEAEALRDERHCNRRRCARRYPRRRRCASGCAKAAPQWTQRAKKCHRANAVGHRP